MMIAMLLPRFAVVFSIFEFVMRGHLFCLKVFACLLSFVLLFMVRCDSVLNVLRLLTALR